MTEIEENQEEQSSSISELPEILPLSSTLSPRDHRLVRRVSAVSSGDIPECRAKLSFGKGEGLLPYLSSGQFSDVKLVAPDGVTTYHTHRLILAYSSGYFHRLLLKRKYVSAETIHMRHVSDPSNVFPFVLQFMYRGQIQDMSTDISIPLLAMADRLEMPELKKITSEFIAGHIQRDNAIPMLKRAFRFQSEQIIERCLDVIAVNFCFIPSSEYNFLPPEYFLRLLARERFNVKEEQRLYKVILKFLDAHRAELSTESEEKYEQFAAKAFAAVRWVYMPLRHLKRAVTNPAVPKDLIIEALIARVQLLENPNQTWNPSDVRLQKRKTYGIQFEFPAERGAAIGPAGRGILAWVSTKGFARDWKNPHISKLVVVTASSISKGSPTDLVGVNPTELWTKDVPASWFCVDFGNNRLVRPTYYTLRHGGNYRADSLRTWDFQGSLNGQSWALLSRHSNDESLNSAFALHSWPVTNQSQAYRYFRVLQTGHNSSNHNFLVLSGIEIYGELFEGPRDSLSIQDLDSSSRAPDETAHPDSHFPVILGHTSSSSSLLQLALTSSETQTPSSSSGHSS